MASASTWQNSAGSPSKNEPGRRRAAALPMFAAAAATLGGLCWWMTAHGYLGDAALDHYARVLTAGTDGIEPGTFHRQGTLVLAQWLGRLSGVPAPLLPYVLDVLACAGVLALLWRDLARAAGPGWAWTLSIAFLLQPLLLWAALSGDGQGMLLLAYHAICRLLSRLRRDAQPVAYLRLAAMLCVFFLLDVRAWPVIVALVPWMLLAVPPELLRRAPFTFHLACLLPLCLLLLGLLHFGLEMSRDPLALLRAAWDAGSVEPLRLSWPDTASWWLSAAAAALLPLVLTGRPADAWPVPLATAAAVICVVLVVGGLQQVWPLHYLVLLLGPVAIALPAAASAAGTRAWALCLLALAGATGGWLLERSAGQALDPWLAALRAPLDAPAGHPR